MRASPELGSRTRTLPPDLQYMLSAVCFNSNSYNNASRAILNETGNGGLEIIKLSSPIQKQQQQQTAKKKKKGHQVTAGHEIESEVVLCRDCSGGS